MKLFNAMMVLLLGVSLTACGGHEFNMAVDEDSFSQNSKVTSVPIDILWVIDNSGSMETSQAKVANNIAAFIQKFTNTNFDYHIAVTTTSAYKSLPIFGLGDSYSNFVDGTAATGHSGIKVIDRNTPNIVDVFKQNVQQGILGSADERGMQSLEGTLLNLNNAAVFPRAGAFLAVIYLTDEEDFSWNGTANIQLLGDGSPNSINDSRVIPISYYVDMLDGITNSTATKKNYNVSAIAIFSEECKTELSTSFTGRRIANRYAQFADATGGVKASLCDPFDDILSNISDSILELTTKFYLNRAANAETLQIFVDDVQIPVEGWTYDPSDLSVTFHAPYIPGKDAAIRVKFQGLSVK